MQLLQKKKKEILEMIHISSKSTYVAHCLPELLIYFNCMEIEKIAVLFVYLKEPGTNKLK